MPGPARHGRRILVAATLAAAWVALEEALPEKRPGAATPLTAATLRVEAARVRDLNGDGDPYADPGEIVRLTLVLRNAGPEDLHDVLLRLATTDPDVACVTRPVIRLPLVPAGATIDTASLGDGRGAFEFVVGADAATVDADHPATADFRLGIHSGKAGGAAATAAFAVPLDLDLPSGPPVPVAGPDGVRGTQDDGRIEEDFDTDRSGDGALRAGFLPGVAGGNDTIGVFVGTAPGGGEILEGVGCGGFRVPPDDPECRIDPDHDMDWHLHCPAGSGEDACPNAPLHRTPAGGSLAYDGGNALHWGVHLDPASIRGDTVHFRTLAAFMTRPVNLDPLPLPGALELSFFHIAVMMDNNYIGFYPDQAADFGDVQVQVDGDADPASDVWGFWDKLVPFENAYDHIAYLWSTFGYDPTYCLLTPTDGGPDPSAPRGVRELLCHPRGVWSSCGARAHDFRGAFTWDCDGPGREGSRGDGVWVRTRFDLTPYAGRRVRIRWIAQSWEFDCCASSYNEAGPAWENARDDGWWIDALRIDGAVETQATPVPDPDPAAGGRCSRAAAR